LKPGQPVRGERWDWKVNMACTNLESSETSSNVIVAVRVRPMNDREITKKCYKLWTALVNQASITQICEGKPVLKAMYTYGTLWMFLYINNMYVCTCMYVWMNRLIRFILRNIHKCIYDMFRCIVWWELHNWTTVRENCQSNCKLCRDRNQW